MEEYILTPEFLMKYIIPDEIADFIIEDEELEEELFNSVYDRKIEEIKEELQKEEVLLVQEIVDMLLKKWKH